MSADFSQCSILKGILQNGSAYNYPAVRFGRVPKREKAKIMAAMQSSRMKTQESKVMSEMVDDGKIIETIVRAHYDTCDYTRNKMEPFLQKARINPQYVSCSGSTCPMKGRPEDSILEQFSERFMDHVRQVCTFAKLIPGFKCLHHDDQVTLLKSCVFEVLLVRLAGMFDNQSLVCLNGDIIRKETIQQMPAGNAKFLMDSVFELAQRINHFRLSDAEIGLFCAIVIITPDRPGLRNPELLQRMQNKLKMVLSSILLPQHPDQATIFGELMTMVHDLRTLNTLHTEKFLQQCKITGQVGGGVQVHRQSMSEDHHPHLRHLNINQHHPMWELDRESTGNGSPQSSDTHSSSSLEDSVSRRSPIGSVSSTESIGPSEIQKLTAQDLRVNGSVLMNALTAPASSNAAATLITAAGGITISRKRLNEECPSHVVTTTASTPSSQQQAAVVGALLKARKLDSPIDSGIDSPRGAQGSSHSTNTSVCSSPRSSVEDENKMASVKESDDEQHRKESPDRYEERHPLLKRALQQPPQIYNGNANGLPNANGQTGMVAHFQDEVYKPHKKFRRNTSGGNTDDCPSSTQAGPGSPPPQATRSERAPTNLLASQLAEPPQYLVQQQRYPSSGGSSLLASTLSRVTTTISTEECRRNEILANLILEGNPAERFSGLPRCMMTAATSTSTTASTHTAGDSYLRQQLQQSKTAVQGLLMCAAGSSPPATTSWWKSSTSTSTVTSPSATLTRHIPVPQPPTRPAALLRAGAPLPSPSKDKLAPSGGASSNLVDSQPLNLSTRTPPPVSVQQQQQQHQHHDIPTEA